MDEYEPTKRQIKDIDKSILEDELKRMSLNQIIKYYVKKNHLLIKKERDWWDKYSKKEIEKMKGE